MIACARNEATPLEAWLIESHSGLLLVDNTAELFSVEYRQPDTSIIVAPADAVILLRGAGTRVTAFVDPDRLIEPMDLLSTRQPHAPEVLFPARFDSTHTLALSTRDDVLVCLPDDYRDCLSSIAWEKHHSYILPFDQSSVLQAIAIAEALASSNDDEELVLRPACDPIQGPSIRLGAVAAQLDDGAVLLRPLLAAEDALPPIHVLVGDITTHRSHKTLQATWRVAHHRQEHAVLLVRQQDALFCLLHIPRDEAQGLLASALLAAPASIITDDPLDIEPGTMITITDVPWRGLSLAIVSANAPATTHHTAPVGVGAQGVGMQGRPTPLPERFTS